MTRHHSHTMLNSEYSRNHAGDGSNLSLPYLEFLMIVMGLGLEWVLDLTQNHLSKLRKK